MNVLTQQCINTVLPVYDTTKKKDRPWWDSNPQSDPQCEEVLLPSVLIHYWVKTSLMMLMNQYPSPAVWCYKQGCGSGWKKCRFRRFRFRFQNVVQILVAIPHLPLPHPRNKQTNKRGSIPMQCRYHSTGNMQCAPPKANVLTAIVNNGIAWQWRRRRRRWW